MSTEAPRQPPFYCPACGKKHRADLSALRGQEGAVAKVTCARCGIVMALRVGADGLPKCEANEPIGGAMSQPESKKPSLLLPIVAAAVVAAAVSATVVALLAPAPSAPAEDPRVGRLEERLETLAGELEAARERETTLRGALDELTSTIGPRIEGAEKTVASLGEAVAGMEQRTAKLATTFLAIQKDHEEHGGRIEANRVATFQLKKRVEALEGE